MDVAVDDRTLRLSRVFDAPCERVFAAWTDEEQFAEWFGPPGLTTLECRLDLRVGGAWRLLAQGSERRHAVSGHYLDVTPPYRLSFTWAWHLQGDPEKPREHETVVTLDFRALGDRTELVMVQGRFRDPDGSTDHNRGWTGSFTKLDEFLRRKT